MNSAQSGKMIVGLDIGTSKVVALVGEVTADGQLEIVGIGTHPSRGLRRAWWSISSPPWPRSSAPLKKPS